MITDQIKELESAKAKVAALEAALSTERMAALASLPGQYGFDDIETFVVALRSAGGKRRGRKPGKTAKAPAAAAAGGRRRRTRAKITDATRAEVKKLVEAGKTGGEIARSVGISLPSVQNIKATLGLVKKRKK